MLHFNITLLRSPEFPTGSLLQGLRPNSNVIPASTMRATFSPISSFLLLSPQQTPDYIISLRPPITPSSALYTHVVLSPHSFFGMKGGYVLTKHQSN